MSNEERPANISHGNMGESELDKLFVRYRAACPEVEPGPNFMPQLWERIDQRGSLWFFFARLGRPLAACAAALCLVLVLLNFGAHRYANVLSYPDALVASHTAENSYFTEGVRSNLTGDERPSYEGR
jgi:hypothetical protein